jgi:hypothetical protein
MNKPMFFFRGVHEAGLRAMRAAERQERVATAV